MHSPSNDALGASNILSASSSSPLECDVGKLLDLHVNLEQLSKDEKYKLLKTEPDMNPTSYPHTRPYESRPCFPHRIAILNRDSMTLTLSSEPENPAL